MSGPGVFFVPAYEQYWYEALSAAARAQMLDDAPSSILLWETAVVKWAAYVAMAASDESFGRGQACQSDIRPRLPGRTMAASR